MKNRLEQILVNIEYNMRNDYYCYSIIKKYRINNNIRFNLGDEDSFLFVDENYYYYYIYLCIFNIS
jgi:hypothetical protein